MFGFLLKCAIVVMVFLMLYPDLQPALAPEAASDAGTVAAPLGETDAAAASVATVMRAAISDAAGFCDRQPDACAGAGVVVDALGERLGEGAAALMRTFGSAGDTAPGASAPAVAESPRPLAANTADRGTLTAEDLADDWSVPATE